MQVVTISRFMRVIAILVFVATIAAAVGAAGWG